MLRKPITYTDYNGVVRTETFYFNLNETELLEMQLGVDGGLGEMLTKIIDAKDQPIIMKLVKEIILKAYGEKSDDGRHLYKSEERSLAFSQTQAYNQLFLELVQNDEAAAKFINAIIPSDLSDKLKDNAALDVNNAKVVDVQSEVVK